MRSKKCIFTLIRTDEGVQRNPSGQLIAVVLSALFILGKLCLCKGDIFIYFPAAGIKAGFGGAHKTKTLPGWIAQKKADFVGEMILCSEFFHQVDNAGGAGGGVA